jgi:hypothetical protein
MVRVALLARLEAKPGQESAVEELLKGALPLANAETATAPGLRTRSGRRRSESSMPSPTNPDGKRISPVRLPRH